MNILDTRDLYERQQELQEELDDLEQAVADAQEVHDEALEARNDCEDAEEQETLADTLNEATAALEDAQEALTDWQEENQEELDDLNSLESEVGREWMHGETLIDEDDFTRYAIDLAEDLYGSEMRNASWPFSCIDWDQAARELQQDYSSCEFQGTTYLFRS